MSRNLIKNLPGYILAALLGAVFVGGLSSIAWASTPDANGTINGCYRTNGGDLRIVDTANHADTCSNKETSLNWSQNGSAAGAVKPAILILNADGAFNQSRSKSITAAAPANNPASPYGTCIQVSFQPTAVMDSKGGDWYMRGISEAHDDEVSSHCLGLNWQVWIPNGTVNPVPYTQILFY